MNGSKLTLVITWLFLQSCSAIGQNMSLPPKIEGKIPFDFAALAKAPDFRWENQKDSVWSLFYEGSEFRGKPTEVFAYYASPATLSGEKNTDQKYPAIVALHGGGGTAFPIWVREWAKKGYAAIAMDLGGAKPIPESKQETPWATKSNRLPNGAPDDTDVHKFYSINKDFSEQWQFHAVANIIRAHSLLRSLADTDTTRTALTGISWGGYLTNITAGIDHRFKAAIPVYGCGFLPEKSVWVSRFDSLGLATSKKWIALWEPSSYVGNVKIPMFYVNGINDGFYYVESWQKTIRLASDARQLLIPKMVHNHEKGAAPIEIEAFVKDAFDGNISTPFLSPTKKIGNWYEVQLNPDIKAQKADFVYTMDVSRNKDRKWLQKSVETRDGQLTLKGEKGIRAAYFLIEDSEGRRWSSEVFVK